jgi:hypothetical protein
MDGPKRMIELNGALCFVPVVAIYPISTDPLFPRLGLQYPELVRIDGISNPVDLRRLIETIVSDLSDDETVGPVSGGFALMADGDVIITPRCCSDFGDEGWSEMIDPNNNNFWTPYWIGHPMLFARKDSSFLYLGENESDNPPDQTGSQTWRLPIDGFRAALVAADLSLRQIAARMDTALQPILLDAKRRTAVVASLLGGSSTAVV